MSATNAPRDLLTRLMDGYLSTQMLYVAARLGIVCCEDLSWKGCYRSSRTGDLL